MSLDQKKELLAEWEISIDDTKHIGEDSLRFILEQSKLLLDDTIHVRDSTENKCTAFLGLLIPLIMALFSAIFELIKTSSSGVVLSIHYSVLALSASLFLCLLIVIPRKRQRRGTLPKNLFRADWLKLDQKEQVKRYLATEIRSYQIRAQLNLRVVQETSLTFLAAVLVASTAPLSFLVVWAFTEEQVTCLLSVFGL